jgi:hypothetical protein
MAGKSLDKPLKPAAQGDKSLPNKDAANTGLINAAVLPPNNAWVN